AGTAAVRGGPVAPRARAPLPIRRVEPRVLQAPSTKAPAHAGEHEREEERAHDEERNLRHHRDQDADDAENEEADRVDEIVSLAAAASRRGPLRHGATAGLIKFVLPATPIGIPAVITAR